MRRVYKHNVIGGNVMRNKTIIILLSLSIAFVFMADGYGFWEKKLVVKTDIDIVAPPSPSVIEEGIVGDLTESVAIPEESVAVPEAIAEEVTGIERANVEENITPGNGDSSEISPINITVEEPIVEQPTEQPIEEQPIKEQQIKEQQIEEQANEEQPIEEQEEEPQITDVAERDIVDIEAVTDIKAEAAVEETN